MKRIFYIMVICVLVLGGCGNKEKPEQPISPTITTALEQPTISPISEPVATPTTEPTVTSIPVQPTQVPAQNPIDEFCEKVVIEDAFCAVSYLGYLEGEYTEVISYLKEKGFAEEYPFLLDITEQQTVLSSGGEWYAVVPTDVSTRLMVYECDVDFDTFELKPGKKLYSDESGDPILIRCNVSDIYPNIVIVVEKENQSLEYHPYISLKDGSLATEEGIYDFTLYDIISQIISENNQPMERFVCSPEQLEGNWLLISDLLEGDISNVIPGYFESIVFQNGKNEDTELGLTVSMEAVDTFGSVREAFYEYSLELLEEPLYSECENEEWCVRIGEMPALNDNGQPSEPVYYVTLLDENTLLRQNYYYDSIGPFVSYQTYKRMSPMGVDTKISVAELEGSDWEMTDYIGEDGIVKSGDLYIHLDIYPECCIRWQSEEQEEAVILDGTWFLGSNGNLLLYGENYETLWLAGAVYNNLTIEESGKEIQLYHDGGIIRLDYVEGSGGENYGGEERKLTSINSTEEFIEAIAPDSYIFVNPGYYNLSDYIEKIWIQEGETWNQNHQYVQIRECFDGVELIIQNVHNLSICGDVESLPDTEIVVEPRYAEVLCFENCSRIDMSFLTMGHTDMGDCEGNVLSFYNCHDINLSAMDIYGCGVYGIGAYEGTGNMYVYSSILRDCCNGPFEIMDGNGRFEFWNCYFTGSLGGGLYVATEESDLAFYECIFGERESNIWYFRDDVHEENCIWSEITEYPDYGYE